MSVTVLKGYLKGCEVMGVTPTFEGLKKFKKIFK